MHTLPASPPALVARAAMPLNVSGTVLDATSGRPIAGVYVQQVNGIAATFTRMNGSFRLVLTTDGSDRLTFTAPSYQPCESPVGSGKGLRIFLHAIELYLPPAPARAVVAVAPTVLTSGVGLAYRLRQQQVNDAGGSIGALADNDFALSGRLRFHSWLFQADGSHLEVPVDVAGLPADQNPAFTPSTYRAGASVGYVFGFGTRIGSSVELALGPSYRYENTKPYNNDVRFIGDGFDFEQTRQALGLEGAAGWRLGRMEFSGMLGGYPLVFAWAIAPGTPFADRYAIQGGVSAKYRIIPDLQLGLAYRYEGWYGNGSDASSLVAVDAFYAPTFRQEARP